MANTNVKIVPPTKEARVSQRKRADAINHPAAIAAVVRDLWAVRDQLEAEFPKNHPVIGLCTAIQKLAVLQALKESKA